VGAGRPRVAGGTEFLDRFQELQAVRKGSGLGELLLGWAWFERRGFSALVVGFGGVVLSVVEDGEL